MRKASVALITHQFSFIVDNADRPPVITFTLLSLFGNHGLQVAGNNDLDVSMVKHITSPLRSTFIFRSLLLENSYPHMQCLFAGPHFI